jgi:hypothetical protein
MSKINYGSVSIQAGRCEESRSVVPRSTISTPAKVAESSLMRWKLSDQIVCLDILIRTCARILTAVTQPIG